jgi:hypothetical protein
MRFGEALEAMRAGCKVRRRVWPPNNYINLNPPNDFWLHAPGCTTVYWCNASDIVACDWEIAT